MEPAAGVLGGGGHGAVLEAVAVAAQPALEGKQVEHILHGPVILLHAEVGYRKKYYLEKRGFTANTQEYIGYDTEIVKDMAKKGTVKVVKDPDTRVVICDERKKAWKDDYSYYYATKRRWPLAVRLSSDVDFIVESIVYLSAFYFIIQGTLREYSAGIIILTFLIDFIVINVVLKHLGQRKLFLTSFTVNTLGFIFQWYYNFYSIFTAKKWR